MVSDTVLIALFIGLGQIAGALIFAGCLWAHDVILDHIENREGYRMGRLVKKLGVRDASEKYPDWKEKW